MLDSQTYTKHRTYLLGTARRLTHSADAAEDLLQETLVYALEHPPGHVAFPRAWLCRVMRNLAANRARRESARPHVESQAARPLAVDPRPGRGVDNEAVERAIQRLPGRLREVVEPFYVRGSGVREIATEVGISQAAVKARLGRARRELRVQLEPRVGWRRRVALSALFLWDAVRERPLLCAGPLATAGLAGPVFVGLGFGGGAPPPRAAGSEASSARVAQAEAHEGPTSSLLVPPAAQAGRRSARRDPSVPATVQTQNAAEPSGSRPAARASVLVTDAEGAPVGGLGVRWVGPDEPLKLTATGVVLPGTGAGEGVTDPEGRVELDLRRAGGAVLKGGHLLVSDPDWVTVFAGALEARDSGPVRVVVAPRAEARGLVLDTDGVPVEGVTVRSRGGEAAYRTLDSADLGTKTSSAVRTDARGEFALTVPDLPGSSALEVRGAKFALQPPQLVEAQPMLFVVERSTGAHRYEGRLLGPEGEPVVGAIVSFGFAALRSKEDGWFSVAHTLDSPAGELIDAWAGSGPRTLWAVAPGWMPVRRSVDPYGLVEGAPGEAPVLSFERPALELAGRVLTDRGQALEGGEVWIADPTFFLFRGKQARSLEQAVRGEEDWAPAPIGPGGRFAIEGLLDRPYRLMIRSPDGRLTQLGPQRPQPTGASDLELRLDPPVAGTAVRVRLVGDQPERLVLERVERLQELRGGGVPGRPEVCWLRERVRGTVSLDEDGRASLVLEPDETLRLVGPMFLEPLAVSRDPQAPEQVFEVPGIVELALSERVRTEATHLEAFDAEGGALRLVSQDARTELPRIRAGLEGRTSVHVSDRVREVVLYRGLDELARLSVAGAAGQLVPVDLAP